MHYASSRAPAAIVKPLCLEFHALSIISRMQMVIEPFRSEKPRLSGCRTTAEAAIGSSRCSPTEPGKNTPFFSDHLSQVTAFDINLGNNDKERLPAFTTLLDGIRGWAGAVRGHGR
jgi:hypothetical protein